MTWYYSPTQSGLNVYDHTGALVVENAEWSGQWSSVPSEVKEIMYAEATAAFQANDNQRVLRILAEAAFEDIEEGTP